MIALFPTPLYEVKPGTQSINKSNLHYGKILTKKISHKNGNLTTRFARLSGRCEYTARSLLVPYSRYERRFHCLGARVLLLLLLLQRRCSPIDYNENFSFLSPSLFSLPSSRSRSSQEGLRSLFQLHLLLDTPSRHTSASHKKNLHLTHSVTFSKQSSVSLLYSNPFEFRSDIWWLHLHFEMLVLTDTCSTAQCRC